ncbi:MAG: VWA domain-containing protein [Vicinamibacteria bacterium]
MRRLLVAAALAAVLTPLVLAQNQRTPTFEVGIEVINLNVSVTDGLNHYVTDLVEKDFAVYEDGVRQELSLFTHENLPISLSIMIDTSASMDEKLPVAQAAAVRFAKTLRSQDQAQVVQFNDRATVLQDFTGEQPALESAIRRTHAAGPTAMYNALYIALKDLEKLKKVGELRRRAVVLLTDGEDTASLVNDDQVLELAKRSEINIYSISIRNNRPTDRERLAFSQAAYVLTTLANETGGQVHFPNSLSELDAVYDRIAEELRTQYNLGYVSANKRRDGKWRRIVVRVPDRESVQVRHRLGYYAAPTG